MTSTSLVDLPPTTAEDMLALRNMTDSSPSSVGFSSNQSYYTPETLENIRKANLLNGIQGTKEEIVDAMA
jgi:hypothetical protein